MNRNKKSKHTKRNIALGVLLAVLCIGAAELAACRWFEPELYERIVAPARYAANLAADTGRAGLNAAGQFCRDVGSAVSHFVVETGQQAAAFWEELTAPKMLLALETTPSPDDSGNPPATPPPVTELRRVDGQQILTGGNVDVVYFCQSSAEWADLPYGTDTIGPYGCGPTVMAMAVSSLTDTDINPAAMANWAVEHGHWASRSGSYHSIVLDAARSFGIMAEPFPSWDADSVLNALEDGKMFVALVGPGHFTSTGHFILLRGAVQDEKVLVADPNSPENSLALWDPQTILDELSHSRSHGGPLWLLWTPAI